MSNIRNPRVYSGSINEELHGNPHYALGRYLGLDSGIRSGSSAGFILKEILVIEKEYLEGKERNEATYWQDIPAVKLKLDHLPEGSH